MGFIGRYLSGCCGKYRLIVAFPVSFVVFDPARLISKKNIVCLKLYQQGRTIF